MIDIVKENVNFREEKPYYIYIHTCPNYWTYVGVSRNPKQRWNNGEGYKGNKYFYKAIQKFGWENIKHEIVAKTNYRWIAEKIERTIITHFQEKEISFNETNIEKKLLIDSEREQKFNKKVGQYDIKTKTKIDEYDNIRIAECLTGVYKYRIIENCEGKRKKAGGYIWKFL